MASDNENVLLENSGRRTRSGRQVASMAPTPRPTRRASKRQAQLSEHEEEPEPIATSVQSNLINDMMSEAAQGISVVENVEELVVPYSQEQLIQTLDDVEMSAAAETGVDEKSSSFPFGSVEHSETSDDAKEPTESSLLASLAGDNANSLPSVGGNDEILDNKNTEFNATVVVQHIQANCGKLESSDSSLSQPAIAEDLPDNADTSSATNVNTEIISEDELPLPSKPEINDAEEVSDDELPAPQRAELPADAEVISEDELPTNNNANEVRASTGHQVSSRLKRKADITADAIDAAVIEEPSQTVAEPKSKSDEQYNPMSPTSESNDATPPQEKKSKLEDFGEHKDKKKEREREKDKEKEKDQEKIEKDKEKERKKLPELDKYWRAVKDDPADFTAWTYLLQYVDNESDAEAAREAYDTFLGHYPYCYGYWRKYADYEKRKGIKANCYAVFERGLEAIPLSVDLWIHYLTHVKANHADDEEFLRNQFERAIAACGLEFRSDKLWDVYLRWENDNKRYERVVQIYDRLLAIPTQTYSAHFDNFQDLINQHPITCTISKAELHRIRKELHERTAVRPLSGTTSASSKSTRSRRDSATAKEKDHAAVHDDMRDELINAEATNAATATATAVAGGKSPKDSNETHVDDPASTTTTDLTESEDTATSAAKMPKVDLSDPSTLSEEDVPAIKDKVISARRKVHKLTVAAVTARWSFEEGIKRPYFHVKPLERAQLKNWKDYLDFEIEKGERKRVLVLFERCLIACALYDEFWLKMIRYLESISEQPDVIKITRGAFRRACQIHHPDKPSLHLMWAAFEECQNNFDGAADVLANIEKKCPNLLQIAYRRINVERRRGDLDKCRELYKYYINTAKNKAIAGSLAIKFARFLNKICKELDAGLEVLRQTLQKDPNNTRVALQMIDLALQRDVVNEHEVVEIMDKFMARENMDPEQKVLFAQRKVEFLEDFGSTAKGLQDAQRALQVTLTKANEAKKKRESSPSRKASTSKEATSAPSTSAQSAYNNGVAAANYNYNSANPSAYYNQQAGAAYQQQTYDTYYNQWQYNSSGSGGGNNTNSNYNYGQWSGYSNYY